MEVQTNLKALGQRARLVSRSLAMLSAMQKNEALEAIAGELIVQTDRILEANARDIEDGRNKGLSEALLDRLLLSEARIGGLARDVHHVASLPDPVGQDMESRKLPNGMHVIKRRIPLGVVGVIYEARPNVTIDIAALCLKTGNASILRGGKETLRSNIELIKVIQTALQKVDMPLDAVQYIDSPDKALVRELLRMDAFIDVLIPRGGAGLHRLCKEQSTIPVITGGVGICHAYVDEGCDIELAVNIVENAKVQRPSVCNALDTVLVNRDVAVEFLPPLVRRLNTHSVSLQVTPDALDIIEQHGLATHATPAGPGDFSTEWMSLVLGIKIVDSMEEAIEHIQDHSMDHTECILSANEERIRHFVRAVNSSAVFVNASTRFNDGGQLGLGAEVAVSTQKLHARGPMGLEELTTYKWIGMGQGQIRE